MRDDKKTPPPLYVPTLALPLYRRRSAPAEAYLPICTNSKYAKLRNPKRPLCLEQLCQQPARVYRLRANPATRGEQKHPPEPPPGFASRLFARTAHALLPPTPYAALRLCFCAKEPFKTAEAVITAAPLLTEKRWPIKGCATWQFFGLALQSLLSAF